MTIDVGFGSVGTAAVVSYGIGWLWYSKLFGDTWLKEMKMTQKEADKCCTRTTLVKGFISVLIMAFTLSIIMRAVGTHEISGAIILATVAWVFVATSNYTGVLWEKKSRKLYQLYIAKEYVGFNAMTITMVLMM